MRTFSLKQKATFKFGYHGLHSWGMLLLSENYAVNLFKHQRVWLAFISNCENINFFGRLYYPPPLSLSPEIMTILQFSWIIL